MGGDFYHIMKTWRLINRHFHTGISKMVDINCQCIDYVPTFQPMHMSDPCHTSTILVIASCYSTCWVVWYTVSISFEVIQKLVPPRTCKGASYTNSSLLEWVLRKQQRCCNNFAEKMIMTWTAWSENKSPPFMHMFVAVICLLQHSLFWETHLGRSGIAWVQFSEFPALKIASVPPYVFFKECNNYWIFLQYVALCWVLLCCFSP